MPDLNIAAGKRDRLVTIQSLTDGVGSSSFPTETPTTLCTLYAFREDVQAPERFTEGMTVDQISARVWTSWVIPYRADMDPELVGVPKERRLVYKGRVYDIVAASPLDRKKGIRLTTIAKAD